MDSSELEALAATLRAEIDRSPARSEIPRIELKDVKSWIVLRKKEAEACSEPSFFLNLL